ncbi:MAG: glycerol kinase [Deltaproteobacteria bacterium]|nr:glycerol kinase [Deltaproteobacteria bacterium]HCH66769.1 glycerol kinase [Deltaproteobacteria bacterium]
MAEDDVILAIDQGTTGTTALLLDRHVRVRAAHNVEFPNHYPQPGWVEHDVAEIWDSVRQAVKGALAAAPNVTIRAIGITNQRETSLFWDRNTGAPIHRALVWQDRRTADICAQLKDDGHEPAVQAATGLVLDPYFSGTKAGWLLDHVPGARERAEAGELLFGTIDAWLAWKLCGTHATDASNASRTLLFDLNTGAWSPDLCALLGVPLQTLPRVCDNAENLGLTRGIDFLPDGIPVSGMAGDQQSALFGQACFAPGTAKCTYGTGAFVLMNTGHQVVRSSHGLLTTVAWRLGGETTFALEGSAFIAGAAVQWLRDGLGLIQSASEIETLAASVPDSGGVVFVPALAGLGAPHWRPNARGLVSGITGGTTSAHLARAVLDGIALQNVDILRAMAADAQTPLAALKVDGGAARNNLLLQLQADLLGVSCVRPTVLETTALGAAFLGGLGAGLFENTQAITNAWVEDRTFQPSMHADEVARRMTLWSTAVSRA